MKRYAGLAIALGLACALCACKKNNTSPTLQETAEKAGSEATLSDALGSDVAGKPATGTMQNQSTQTPPGH